MPIELRVPSVGESITEVQVSKWLKKEGEAVRQDEPLVELETEKTTLEVPSPSAGKLQKIVIPEGEFTTVDAVLGLIDEQAETERPAPKPPEAPEQQIQKRGKFEERFAADREEREKVAPSPEPRMREPRMMPSARREMAERGIEPSQVEGTGPGGRVTREDVLRATGEPSPAKEKPAEKPVEPEIPEQPQPVAKEAPVTIPPEETRTGPAPSRGEESVPMSPMRLRIAQRLVEAQQNAALLTTFNEIDMSQIMRLRKQYQETFQKEYGIKLGFMSFFVKVIVEALKRIPQVNAEIRGRNIVYRNYYDIGIAIGSGKGLVVPILRNAESMSLAQVERAIDLLANRVQEKKITPEELEGGTFTITNGGIYGSLLSTPIINPPQSGILGMHAIQDRPVAIEGQVVIRPMMYVALTYDHRLVDGREAVTFLKHVKDLLEEPSRILLEI